MAPALRGRQSGRPTPQATRIRKAACVSAGWRAAPAGTAFLRFALFASSTRGFPLGVAGPAAAKGCALQPRAVLFHPDGPWCPAMEKKLGRGPEKELKAATQLFSRARAGEGVGVGERRFEWNFVWVVATGRIFLFASRLGSGGWEEGQKQVGLGRPQRPEANFCLWGRVAMTQNAEHPGAHVFAAGSVTPV